MAHIGACTIRLRNETPRMLIGSAGAGNSGDECPLEVKIATSDDRVGILRLKACLSCPGLHEAGRRRRTPDHRVVAAPNFGPLRFVSVPWTRLEIAQLLVFHLIELDIEFHKLIILVPVKDGYVVT